MRNFIFSLVSDFEVGSTSAYTRSGLAPLFWFLDAICSVPLLLGVLALVFTTLAFAFALLLL